MGLADGICRPYVEIFFLNLKGKLVCKAVKKQIVILIVKQFLFYFLEQKKKYIWKNCREL